MNSRFQHLLHKSTLGLGLLLLVEAPGTLLGEPPPPASTAAFDTYTQALEARLNHQHQSPATFLSPSNAPPGTPILEALSPPPSAMPAGALLHHWRATVFLPGARAADFEQLLRHFDAYPRVFAPEVLEAHILTASPDHLEAAMRVRQHHVLTVVLDTTYDIRFGRLDPTHGFSTSRSTRIAELAEHTLQPTENHGFLWRQNTYWTWAEQPGPTPGHASGHAFGHASGLAIQVESVSLTRAIPAGLGWAVRPYVESIPRESLEFTLRAVAQALQQP